jgi:adenylylsulfate kinase
LKNITWHRQKVSQKDREKLLNQRGALIWFTGISGSGKSTLANDVAKKLHQMGKLTYVLDGDNIRHGLCKDLGFSKGERSENIRRIGEVSKLFVEAGVIVNAAFISPYKKDRDAVRRLLGKRFVEVHLRCPPGECLKRDPKGLYKKKITGVSDPYEAPKKPEIMVDTSLEGRISCAEKVLGYLIKKRLI